MNIQNSIIVLFGVYSLIGFLLGVKNTKFKKNPYGLTPWLNPMGAFVWADAVIFGAFFFLASVLSLILHDFILFLLIFFVFWAVRSIGEQTYWFLEQYADKHKNPPHTLWLSNFFPAGSTWIAMQISWQCVSVISIIASAYLFSLWL